MKRIVGVLVFGLVLIFMGYRLFSPQNVEEPTKTESLSTREDKPSQIPIQERVENSQNMGSVQSSENKSQEMEDNKAKREMTDSHARGEVYESREKKIREFQNSPQYQEMQKYREEYRKWQENLVSQMQEAFKRGDMARVSELRMKLIRKEGAPERPKVEGEDKGGMR